MTVGELYSRASARCARLFLDQLIAQVPFKVQCIQVDGGSEFRAEFEQHCHSSGIRLIVLPPRSPQMNTRVEYVHGTCRREFWNEMKQQVELTVSGLTHLWHQWLERYNRVRPHESLDMMTP